MRTQDEINKMIQNLEAEKSRLPEFSAFGNNNWEQIDEAITVLLEKETDEDAIYEKGLDHDQEMYAITAVQWLNGEVDDDELVED